MFHKRIKARHKGQAAGIRSHPVKHGPASGIDPADPRIMDGTSFSHHVMFAGAHGWRAAVAPILHGRTPRQGHLKPHEHQNGDINYHLSYGAHLRPAIRNKNV